MKLLLFDVDGTLILTARAGVRAMTRAFQTVFGVADAFIGVPMAGRTDPAILGDALAACRIDPSPPHLEAFAAAYFPLLAEELDAPVPAASDGGSRRTFKGPLPGIRDLIAELERLDSVFLGLLTGNYAEGARIKLSYFDLWRQFRCGAYGGDAPLRHELVAIAVDRARAAGCPPVAPSDVVIIGDTALDVDCARRAGVACVAVATGGTDRAALLAAGADVVFEDLRDTGAAVAALMREPG